MKDIPDDIEDESMGKLIDQLTKQRDSLVKIIALAEGMVGRNPEVTADTVMELQRELAHYNNLLARYKRRS